MTTYWIGVLINLKLIAFLIMVFLPAFTFTTLIIDKKLPNNFSQGVLVLFISFIVFILIPKADILSKLLGG